MKSLILNGDADAELQDKSFIGFKEEIKSRENVIAEFYRQATLSIREFFDFLISYQKQTGLTSKILDDVVKKFIDRIKRGEFDEQIDKKILITVLPPDFTHVRQECENRLKK